MIDKDYLVTKSNDSIIYQVWFLSSIFRLHKIQTLRYPKVMIDSYFLTLIIFRHWTIPGDKKVVWYKWFACGKQWTRICFGLHLIIPQSSLMFWQMTDSQISFPIKNFHSFIITAGWPRRWLASGRKHPSPLDLSKHSPPPRPGPPSRSRSCLACPGT